MAIKKSQYFVTRNTYIYYATRALSTEVADTPTAQMSATISNMCDTPHWKRHHSKIYIWCHLYNVEVSFTGFHGLKKKQF